MALLTVNKEFTVVKKKILRLRQCISRFNRGFWLVRMPTPCYEEFYAYKASEEISCFNAHVMQTHNYCSSRVKLVEQ